MKYAAHKRKVNRGKKQTHSDMKTKPLSLIAVAAAICIAALSCENTVDVSTVKIQEGGELVMAPGEEKQLTVVITPENADYDSIVWDCSDTDIATITQEGLLSALKVGKAVVSATVGEVRAECYLTVSVPATGISLDKDHLTFNIGDDGITLVATVAPDDATDKTVTWSSSNDAVATVNENGLVSPVGAGEATVSAKCGEFTAECKVTVNVPITGISLDKTSIDLSVGGESITLTATITPDNATDKTITWTSSNPEIASVTNEGLVTGLKAGTATISATAGNMKAECIANVTDPNATTWNIGDYYEEGSVKGIVVIVSEDKQHGKIMSLDQSSGLWATGSYNTGATSEEDGKSNTDKVKSLDAALDRFPAFKWCVEKGDGWYLPAYAEAKEILANKAKIDPVIASKGGDALPTGMDPLWTSTESEDDYSQALTVYIYRDNVTSYGDFKDDPEAGTVYIRAMYAF